jgi:hypothetical protein
MVPVKKRNWNQNSPSDQHFPFSGSALLCAPLTPYTNPKNQRPSGSGVFLLPGRKEWKKFTTTINVLLHTTYFILPTDELTRRLQVHKGQRGQKKVLHGARIPLSLPKVIAKLQLKCGECILA